MGFNSAFKGLISEFLNDSNQSYLNFIQAASFFFVWHLGILNKPYIHLLCTTYILLVCSVSFMAVVSWSAAHPIVTYLVYPWSMFCAQVDLRVRKKQGTTFKQTNYDTNCNQIFSHEKSLVMEQYLCHKNICGKQNKEKGKAFSFNKY